MGKNKRLLFVFAAVIMLCVVFNGRTANAADSANIVKKCKVTIDMDGHGEDIVFEVEPNTTLREADVIKRQDLKETVADDPSFGGVRVKPLSEYSNYEEFNEDSSNYEFDGEGGLVFVGWKKTITEDTTIYGCWLKVIDKLEFSVNAPKCGMETKFVDIDQGDSQTYKPEVIIPDGAGYDIAIHKKYSDGTVHEKSFWVIDELGSLKYEGKFVADTKYYAWTTFEVKFPYKFKYFDTSVDVKGAETGTVNLQIFPSKPPLTEGITVYYSLTATHDWDEGTVTKEATIASEGEKTFTCKVCGATKKEVVPKLPEDEKPDPTDPNKMGEDGTPYGKGASKAAVDKAITSLASENDPAGTAYGLLQLKVTKTTKNSVTVKWQKVVGAKTYMVYASNCGKKNKCVKVAELGSGKTTFTVNKKTLKKAIKKGTYYKVWVAALDKDDMVITTSKVVHGATKGGKVGDHKKVTTKAKKNKVSIKAKKTFKLRAKAIAKSKKMKVKRHRGIKYETSNPTVATVNAKGVIKGVKKGTCYVYAYAQNGVAAKIKVTVK